MNNKLVELGIKFKKFKDDYKVQEDALKLLGGQWEECERELLDAMVEEGVNSIDIDGVGKLSMRTENYLSVNTANTPLFYSYLKESGNGTLLKEYVNPRTLTSFLKEHLELKISEIQSVKEIDEFDARNEALEFLKSKGAAYFQKKSVSLRAS